MSRVSWLISRFHALGSNKTHQQAPPTPPKRRLTPEKRLPTPPPEERAVLPTHLPSSTLGIRPQEAVELPFIPPKQPTEFESTWHKEKSRKKLEAVDTIDFTIEDSVPSLLPEMPRNEPQINEEKSENVEEEELPEPMAALFAAIRRTDRDTVRALLASNRALFTRNRHRYPVHYPPRCELDAYRFLGAYIGSLTALQYAILLGDEPTARDILDATFDADIDIRFGDGNTALHLAAFMNRLETVGFLLERGADLGRRNGKGFTPVDVAQDPDVIETMSLELRVAKENNN